MIMSLWYYKKTIYCNTIWKVFSGFPWQNTQPLFALACSSSSQPQCAQGEFQPRTLNQGKYNHLSLENRLIQEQHDPLQTAIPHRLPIKVPSFFSNLCSYFPLHFFSLKVRKEGKILEPNLQNSLKLGGGLTPRAVKLRVFLLLHKPQIHKQSSLAFNF